MAHPLRSYRLQNGIKLHELASKLDVTIGTLSRIENGKQDASADLLRRIAVATAGEVLPNDMLAVAPIFEVAV